MLNKLIGIKMVFDNYNNNCLSIFLRQLVLLTFINWFYLRFISNKYLRTRNAEGTEQLVEWGYAFDVHLNAFFPLLVILHVIQLFFVKCK